jgi:MoxR-like ATPase
MRIEVGYPDPVAEREIIMGYRDGAAIDALRPVLSTAQVNAMIKAASGVHVAEPLQDYVVQLSAATREGPDVRLGASPRGSIALVRAARVRAASQGREFVIPEDIKALAPSVLAHRIIVDPEAELRGMSSRDLVREVLAAVPVPQVSDA